MERGLTQHLESIPTPRLGRTIDTNASSLHENRFYRRSDVLVLDEEDSELRCGDVLSSEATNRRTQEERKAGEVVCNQPFPLV